MNRALILGTGMVVKPLIEYLFENGISVLIASPMKERSESMINGNSLGTSIDWSVDDPDTLEILIREHDIVVSLLPYIYHPEVASLCVKHQRPLITTSHIQPGVMALDEEARRAGIILLNEMGFEPGIDHMSAMKIIDHIHARDGRVEELYSISGALPAPEAADNPLRHKFTWSPKGEILAGKNEAHYLKNGKEIYVEPDSLFKERFSHHFPGVGDLEVYPNGDSASYIGIYGIPYARTIYRGTFRHKGWCITLDAMMNLKLLDDTPKDYTRMSYAGFLAERAGCPAINLKQEIANLLGIPENSTPIEAFEFLGLFSSEILDYKETTPFHITSDRMIRRMTLCNDERDMVLLQHILLASYTDGKREVIRSSMAAYGTPSANTAISLAVALPAAIAVKLILQKKITLAGVYRPVIPEIYNPVLEELKTLGIEMKEEYGLPESDMTN